jgi:hypothetical protein
MRAVEMTTPKPTWRVLPIVMAVMAALLSVVERVALPPSVRTLLQSLVTAGGFSCIGLWIRWNRAAIALEEWDGRNEDGPAASSLLVRVDEEGSRS